MVKSHGDGMKTILIVLLLIIMSGCSVAVGGHMLLPPAQYLNAAPKEVSEVGVYSPHTRPTQACLRLAQVEAHGNGYATYETLQETLVVEAAEIGADYLLVDALQVTADETVGTYAAGVMISSQIHRPHLSGTACRSPKVTIGLHFKDQLQGWLIRYVMPQSPADEAGFKEGETLLTVNGVFVPDNPYLFDREVAEAKPGDQMTFEVLDKKGDKIVRNVRLRAASEDTAPKPVKAKSGLSWLFEQ
jgi:hypothetical protein